MPIIKVLLLADLHSNFIALTTLMDKVHDEYGKPDYIIGLGDFVGYGAQPNEVLEFCKKEMDVMIMGNHDLAVTLGNADGFNRDAKKAALWNNDQLTIENKTYLSFLEQQQHFFIFEKWAIFCVHGHPIDPINGYLRPETPNEKKDDYLRMIPRSRFMFTGHTHLPMYYKGKDTIIINPGSVGQPRDRDPRSSACMLLVSEDPEYLEYNFIRVEYNITECAREMRKVGLPHRLSERLFFGE
ncbi:MAG: metallophosphoesterase family protein [Candidatus Hodarchaeales archaeon]|jgi:putative phosphoesterase